MHPILARLTYYQFQFEIYLDEPLRVMTPQDRSILFRGALGDTLRDLVCHDQSLQCETCARLPECAYGRLFRATPDPARRVPRPLILVDPEPTLPELSGRQAFGLILVGSAVDLPLVVAAIETLGESGMGRNRVRFEFLSVRCVDGSGEVGATVWDPRTEGVKSARLALRASDLAQAGDELVTQVRVDFVTPTQIRGYWFNTAIPPCDALVSYVAGRLQDLVRYYCGGDSVEQKAFERPEGAPAEQWVQVGEKVLIRKKTGEQRQLGNRDRLGGREQFTSCRRVTTLVSRLEWVEHGRKTQQGPWQSLAGLRGFVVYDGPDLNQAMPWLRAAEVFGVGKGVSFGNGRIRVRVLAKRAPRVQPPESKKLRVLV